MDGLVEVRVAKSEGWVVKLEGWIMGGLIRGNGV
jgi:hypothetical protein